MTTERSTKIPHLPCVVMLTVSSMIVLPWPSVHLLSNGTIEINDMVTCCQGWFHFDAALPALVSLLRPVTSAWTCLVAPVSGITEFAVAWNSLYFSHSNVKLEVGSEAHFSLLYIVRISILLLFLFVPLHLLWTCLSLHFSSSGLLQFCTVHLHQKSLLLFIKTVLLSNVRQRICSSHGPNNRVTSAGAFLVFVVFALRPYFTCIASRFTTVRRKHEVGRSTHFNQTSKWYTHSVASTTGCL